MVKEVPQPSKHQCEGCDKIYSSRDRAIKCENKGLPEFKYNLGDKVETVVSISKISEVVYKYPEGNRNPFMFDVIGTFSEVKIIDRYHWDHIPLYVFEHPQMEGQYWRYSELAFELSKDLANEYKDSVSDPDVKVKMEIFPGYGIEIPWRRLSSRGLWKGFLSRHREHGVRRKYTPEIVAEPINPT